MAKKESAEEKLLKIIEATKKAPGVAASDSVAVVAPKRSSSLELNVRQINGLLLVCVVAAVLFLAYEINQGVGLLNQEVTLESQSGAVVDAGSVSAPQVRNLAYYFEKISTRNIFKPYEKPVAGEDGVTSANAGLQKKMSKYKVVGIAWLDVPESATVMMEDTSTHLTHFLKVGEKLEDVAVKTIYTDRVVFGYANEEIVIKL